MFIACLVQTGLFVTYGPTRTRYVTEWNAAESACRHVGAQLATEDAILEVTANWSTCCQCGWTSSIRPRYPSNLDKPWCPLDDLDACINWMGRLQNVWCQADIGKMQGQFVIQVNPSVWSERILFTIMRVTRKRLQLTFCFSFGRHG